MQLFVSLKQYFKSIWHSKVDPLLFNEFSCTQTLCLRALMRKNVHLLHH